MTKTQKIAIGVVVGLPLSCCLGGFGLLQGVFGGSARSLDRELALAHREGIPTTPEELVEATRPPGSEDAYPFYPRLLHEAGEHGRFHQDVNAAGEALGTRVLPKQQQDADRALGRIQPVLELARKAGAYPHVYVPRDWSKAWKLGLEDVSVIRNCARALLADALKRDQGGDWQGALDDINDAQHLGRQQGDTPTMIGMLVQIAVEGASERVLDRLIDAHSQDRAFLTAAKRLHDGFGPLANFRRAMMGELIIGRIGIATLKSPREFTAMDDEVKPTAFETAFFQSPIVHDAFDAKLLHFYRWLINHIPSDPSQWEAAEQASKNTGKLVEEDHSLANYLNQILFPVFSQAAEAIGTMQTRRNLTDTALRLLQQRAETGKLPKFLPHYGATAVDPFSKNPLIYRREGAGFILYGVGQDRIDNGGTPEGEGVTTGTDEVLRIH